jgi:hypothetical protein
VRTDHFLLASFGGFVTTIRRFALQLEEIVNNLAFRFIVHGAITKVSE